MTFVKGLHEVSKMTKCMLISCFLILILSSNFSNGIPQRGGGNQDSCEVDADCQKNGQTNRCCSQFYFCGTGPDYCAEGDIDKTLLSL